MYIVKKYFPEVMCDNDNTYFSHLYGIIESVDELTSMEITRKPDAYLFRIATSLPKYNPLLLEELLKFHNMFGIKMDMSKSIKSSSTISFQIKTQ